MQKSFLTIHTDGGSRGNPGLAACAFVSEYDGKIIEERSRFLDTATNNVAEYQGVILALEWLLENKPVYDEVLSYNEVLFLLDSELVVKQLTGLYKIKNHDLLTLSIRINRQMIRFGIKIHFRNVPREQNKRADFLVNEELDKHK